MKQASGNLAISLAPVLILAALAGSGWYYYQDEAQALNDQQEQQKEERREFNATREALETRVAKLEESEQSLQSQLQSLDSRHRELIQNTGLLDSENSSLAGKLDNLNIKLQELSRTIDSLNGENAALREELQNQTRHTESLKGENAALREELQNQARHTELTTAELEAELARRQAEQQALNRKISSVSDEKSALLSQLEREQASKREIANLKNRLAQELDESRVEISELKNRMTVIKLTSEVLFSSGSAEIKPAGKKVLALIAESLNQYPQRAISVEGHTDNVPVKSHSRYASNWDLSSARSLAAADFFQRQSNVDPRRLRVVGYGEYHPVATNETAEGRQLNRRIEIRMLPPQPLVVDE